LKFLRPLADRRNPHSLSSTFRRKRGKHLTGLLACLHPPITILDVGGEASFWETVDVAKGANIVLLNTEPQSGDRFTFVQGDARDLSQFGDRAFDVVISNSVIEHVDDQPAMAREIRRVGKRYYVQTPNFWFPIDPHFLLPFFHWLPRAARIIVLMRFNVGWLTRADNRRDAEMLIDSVRPLSARELKRLFPGARIWRERFLGMTKSLVVYYGWSDKSSVSRSGESVGSAHM